MLRFIGFLAMLMMCCEQDNVLVMATPKRAMLSVGCSSLFVKQNGG